MNSTAAARLARVCVCFFVVRITGQYFLNIRLHTAPPAAATTADAAAAARVFN